jgi:hypothetical protein
VEEKKPMTRIFLRRAATALFLVLFLCAPCRAEKLRFAVLSDCQGSSSEQQVNLDVLGEISERLLALDPKPAFIVLTGDLVYRSKLGDKWAFDTWRFAVRPLTDAGIKIYPAVGNHDLYQEQKGTLYRESQVKFQTFFKPDVPQNGPKGYESLVYSFTSPGGDAFFAILDSYYIDPANETAPYVNKDSSITKPQLDWLRNQLKTTKARFKFAAMHTPVFNIRSAAVPQCDQSGHCELWRILDANRFAMSLAGHLHLYSRKTIGPDVNPEFQRGVIQVIAGGAGGPLDNAAHSKADTNVWHVKDVFHYLVVDIDGDTLTAQVTGKVDNQWREIDNFMFSVK